MELFIGNLSLRTSYNDLAAHLAIISKDARLQIFDKLNEDGTTCRYAIATIETDHRTLKAIQMLDGEILHGNSLMLREFVPRNYGFERRIGKPMPGQWPGVERRANERRH